MIDAASMQERLSKEFGIDGLPEAEKEKLLEGVSQNLIEAFLLSVMRKLPVEAKDAFEQAVEGGDKSLIESIMRTHIPDLDAFLEAEILAEIAHLKRLQAEALDQK